MIENKEIQVGEEKMTIQSLPATRALSIIAKLAKVTGGMGLGVTDIPLSASEIPEAFHIGNMVQGLLQNIDADGAPQLLRSIVRESIVVPTYEGEAAEQRFNDWYEVRFSRGLKDLMVLLYEIFSYNYGDPVDMVKKAWARAIEHGLLSPSVPLSTETAPGAEQTD